MSVRPECTATMLTRCPPHQRSAASSTKELRMSREDLPVPHDAQKAPEIATKPPSPLQPLHPSCNQSSRRGREMGSSCLSGPGSSPTPVSALSWGMMEVDKVAAGQGNRVSP